MTAIAWAIMASVVFVANLYDPPKPEHENFDYGLVVFLFVGVVVCTIVEWGKQ